MGSFFSTKNKATRLEHGDIRDLKQLMTQLKFINPSLVITTLALKEGDSFVPSNRIFNHYTITYKAENQHVIALYG
jgi:hypothetical protein